MDEDWKHPLEEGAAEDVSITAAYIMLRVIELGVYTTWCNYFANSKLEQAFDLPENEKSVLIMPSGYLAGSIVPASAHTETKNLKEVVRYLYRIVTASQDARLQNGKVSSKAL